MSKSKLAEMEDRIEYFKDKRIMELTTDEINEFLKYRAEVKEIINGIKEVWSALKPYFAEEGE